MSNPSDMNQDPDDLDLMLPWLATGALGARDRRRLDAALRKDDERMRRLSVVREELDETVRLNEALGAPSPKAAEALFRLIDADPARPVGLRRRLASLGERTFYGLARPTPRALGWAAAAALLLILAQAGGIALLLKDRAAPATYETASGPEAPQGPGSYVLVGFTPEATAAEITDTLQTFQASIADGPRSGGLYRIRVSDAALDPQALNAVVGRMRQNAAVIRMVLPSR